MRAIGWTAAWLLLALAGCRGQDLLPAPPPPPEGTPPVRFDIPTGKLALAPVTIALPPKKGIGSYDRNVDCWVHVGSVMPKDFPDPKPVTDAIEQALEAAKLKVFEVPGSEVDQAKGADYLLVTSIHAAHADLCIDNLWNEGPADIDAQVQISWQLWSVRDHRVVLDTATIGGGHAADPNQKIEAGILVAAADATQQFLRAAATQQYLTYGKVLTPVAVPGGTAAAAVPAGGSAPIPAPPPGIPAAASPTIPPAFEAILLPVKSAHPAGTAIDALAIRRATVAIESGGAALVLGDGYLLTATATLGNALAVKVSLSAGTETAARVIRQDARSGVALLQVEATLPPALPVQPRRNQTGDTVLGVGPEGVVRGSFTATRAKDGRDAVALPGAIPGGPVLDPAGNVIGILEPDGGFTSIGIVFRALQLGAQPSED